MFALCFVLVLFIYFFVAAWGVRIATVDLRGHCCDGILFCKLTRRDGYKYETEFFYSTEQNEDIESRVYEGMIETRVCSQSECWSFRMWWLAGCWRLPLSRSCHRFPAFSILFSLWCIWMIPWPVFFLVLTETGSRRVQCGPLWRHWCGVPGVCFPHFL